MWTRSKSKLKLLLEESIFKISSLDLISAEPPFCYRGMLKFRGLLLRMKMIYYSNFFHKINLIPTNFGIKYAKMDLF